MSRSIRRWIDMVALSALLAACAGAPPQPAPDAAAPQQEAADPAVAAAYQEGLDALRAGRYAEAERRLRPLTEQHPQHRGPWLNLALAVARQERAEEAERLLRQVLERHPDFAEAHHELALLQRRAGRFAEARRGYDAAIAQRPDFALAYRNLGLLCDLYLHDEECALSNYRKYRDLTLVNDEEVAQWIADLQRRMAVSQ